MDGPIDGEAYGTTASALNSGVYRYRRLVPLFIKLSSE